MHVYIAGPLTQGDPIKNTRQAILAAEQVRLAGHVPFVPHMNLLWDFVVPDVSYEDWLAWDFQWLGRCDALIRLPGESPGADREVEHAHHLGIHVYTLEQFLGIDGQMGGSE